MFATACCAPFRRIDKEWILREKLWPVSLAQLPIHAPAACLQLFRVLRVVCRVRQRGLYWFPEALQSRQRLVLAWMRTPGCASSHIGQGFRVSPVSQASLLVQSETIPCLLLLSFQPGISGCQRLEVIVADSVHLLGRAFQFDQRHACDPIKADIVRTGLLLILVHLGNFGDR